MSSIESAKLSDRDHQLTPKDNFKTEYNLPQHKNLFSITDDSFVGNTNNRQQTPSEFGDLSKGKRSQLSSSQQKVSLSKQRSSGTGEQESSQLKKSSEKSPTKVKRFES